MSTPAEMLEGEVINGWLVEDKIPTFKGSTGGAFSTGYFVTKDEKRAFLKAMDLHGAMKKGLRAIEITTRQYNFERELLCLCRDKRLSNVVRLLDDGEYELSTLPDAADHLLNRVYYMVFELAAGDIRREMSFGEKGASWKAHVLHQVAVALAQLHKTDIAHQDLKPSNVLGFPELRKYKLSDLGRSSSKSIAAPTDGLAFPGDMNYAPPEYFYGYIPPDYHDRRYGSDGYLLGSMISFLFMGLGAINLTFGNLAYGYRPEEWEGKYEDVLPFLVNAHTAATASIKGYLPQQFREELAKIYFELCHPDPHLRGHPQARAQAGRLIGLDRYMSRFNLFAAKLKIEERVKNA